MEPAKRLFAAVADLAPPEALSSFDPAFAALVLGAGRWGINPKSMTIWDSPDATTAEAARDGATALEWLVRLDAADRRNLYALPRRLSPFMMSYLAFRREFLALREGMTHGRRPRDEHFIRAGAGTVGHELQLRLFETEAFARCLQGISAPESLTDVATVEQEIFGLGEESAVRVRRLTTRAARWHRATREECAFLLPGKLLAVGQHEPPRDLTAAERIFDQFDPAQRTVLEEASGSLESLREAQADLRDTLLSAFHQMRSALPESLSELFAIASTYSVLETRIALVEAKAYMRVAATLRLDQRRNIGELIA